MAEQFDLATPIVSPATSIINYKVVSLLLNLELVTVADPGTIIIELKDNFNVRTTHLYTGQQAIDFIRFMNTANFSTNSMHKRILQKLQADGKLPPGTVTGTPE